MTTVRVLGAADAHLLEHVEADVFDAPVRAELVRELLEDPRHHLVVGLEEGRIVGMASAVHYIHPDKPAELWINELGVALPWRGRGLGGRLVEALLDLGRSLGCREAWVLTESDRAAANAVYQRGGGRRSDAVMYSWALEPRQDG